MNFYKKMVVAALFAAASIKEVDAAGYSKKYGYLFNGADWPLDPVDTECAKTN